MVFIPLGAAIGGLAFLASCQVKLTDDAGHLLEDAYALMAWMALPATGMAFAYVLLGLGEVGPLLEAPRERLLRLAILVAGCAFIGGSGYICMQSEIRMLADDGTWLKDAWWTLLGVVGGGTFGAILELLYRREQSARSEQARPSPSPPRSEA